MDGAFWRTSVEMNPLLLFFVPDEYHTEELYRLAVQRYGGEGGGALRYVPVEKRSAALCAQAVYNTAWALEFVPPEVQTLELCQKAVKALGSAFEFVTEHIKTSEPEGRALCRAAVKDAGLMLRYVPEQYKTTELCLEAVKEWGYALAFVPEALKTPELCLHAMSSKPKDISAMLGEDERILWHTSRRQSSPKKCAVPQYA
jgi:hypothetical protein